MTPADLTRLEVFAQQSISYGGKYGPVVLAALAEIRKLRAVAEAAKARERFMLVPKCSIDEHEWNTQHEELDESVVLALDAWDPNWRTGAGE